MLFQFLSVVPALVQAVVVTVAAVEAPGHGPEKKAAVLEVVDATYTAAAETGELFGYKAPPGLEKDTVLKLAGELTEVAVRLMKQRALDGKTG
mgnify:FL=1